MLRRDEKTEETEARWVHEKINWNYQTFYYSNGGFIIISPVLYVMWYWKQGKLKYWKKNNVPSSPAERVGRRVQQIIADQKKAHKSMEMSSEWKKSH